MGLCNPLLYNARIGYENTYDMRENYCFLYHSFDNYQNLRYLFEFCRLL